MELPGEDHGPDAHALQVRGQRLHFSTRIGQVSLSYFVSDNAAALDSNLEPFERFRDLPQGIVGTVEAVEPTRVILLIETFRPQQEVEVAKRAMNLEGSMIRVCGQRRRVRRCAALPGIGWQCGLKSQTILPPVTS